MRQTISIIFILLSFCCISKYGNGQRCVAPQCRFQSMPDKEITIQKGTYQNREEHLQIILSTLER
ncbi:MAG: hypothetical protein ACTHNG_13310 [Ginsengibacter sp.]